MAKNSTKAEDQNTSEQAELVNQLSHQGIAAYQLLASLENIRLEMQNIALGLNKLTESVGKIGLFSEERVDEEEIPEQ